MFKYLKKYFKNCVFFVIVIIFVSCKSSVSDKEIFSYYIQSKCINPTTKTEINYPKCSNNTPENQICSLNLLDLKPTQFNYGQDYVIKLSEKFRNNTSSLQELLCSKPLNVVIGPKAESGFFLTDGHHRVKLVERIANEKSINFTILVKVENNFMLDDPKLDKNVFWNTMIANNNVYLKDKGIIKSSNKLPTKFLELTNDPYRSLVAYIEDDKSKFCFDSSLSTFGNYGEFYWADYFRNYKKLDKYTDRKVYNFYKNKILYFVNLNNGKKENICKLSSAIHLPGYTNQNNKEPTLVIDSINEKGELKNFRTMQMIEKVSKNNIKGLNKLKASGSAQFSENQLNWIIQNTSKNLILVDLRQESHGFINGNPVTWTAPFNWANIGKSKNNILIDESVRLNELLFQDYIAIPTSKNYKNENFNFNDLIKLEINEISREDELASKNQIGYFRLTVTDHSMPSDEDVDEFLSFVKTLKEDTWLHFHCRGGKGRTTTFLAMFDMLFNAHLVSFNDIIQRQSDVKPNYNLLDVKRSRNSSLSLNRLEFLKEFYKFSKDYNNCYKGTWKQWKLQKNS